MIALLRKRADPGDDEDVRWARMCVHYVRNDMTNELGYSSKLNAEWEFLSMLKQAGRDAADTFLGQHDDDIGKRSTLNLDALLGEL